VRKWDSRPYEPVRNEEKTPNCPVAAISHTMFVHQTITKEPISEGMGNRNLFGVGWRGC